MSSGSIQHIRPVSMLQAQEREEDAGEENSGFSYFQSSLFATVLEDTITEFRILFECNNELRINKTMVDMPLLRALKYGMKQAVRDPLSGIDHKNIGCGTYKLDKLDADRKFVNNVIIDTYKDLSLDRECKKLAEHVNAIVERKDHFTFLLEDEAKNRLTRRELNKQLRQQRNHMKSVTYDTDVIIDLLKTQVEDATLNAEMRGRYIDNWQRARTEQHHQTILDKEAKPSEIIEYYKQRIDHEQRVHTEVELLINIAINETLQKIENWMNKYDRDMETIDLKIQIKKNEYQNALDRRRTLEDMIEKHGQLMTDWVHFKDEREKARAYHEKMTKCAIVVQAWWRGLLVRLQLGPYKVVKKKGAPPAKGKKK